MDLYFSLSFPLSLSLGFSRAAGGDGPKGAAADKAGGGGDDDDDEEDPLDAFMAGIESEVKRQAVESKDGRPEKKKGDDGGRGVRDDIEEEDDHELYFQAVREGRVGARHGDDEDVEYDEDGYPIKSKRDELLLPIPALDHSKIEYMEINKNFYQEHEQIAALSDAEVAELRRTMNITVSGAQVPKVCAA